MRQIGSRTVGAGILLAAFLGCGAPDEPADTTARGVTGEVTEAADEVAAYAATQRRELEQRAQSAIEEMDSALEDAQAKLAEVPVETRQRLDAAIDRAQRAKSSVGKELDELKAAGAERWESAQQRLSEALDEMDEARREIGAALMGSEPSGS